MATADIGTAPIPVPAGQVLIAMPPQRLRCTVGSGLALILVDIELKLAGLAHILLPTAGNSLSSGMPAKHADRAVPALLEALAAHHAARWRLEAIVVGAARDLRQPTLGQSNLDALRSSLAGHAIPVSQETVGGTRIRSLIFDPRYAELVVEEQGKI